MKKHGFTLIELMIVVAIIAIIAAIAIPNLLRSRLQSNESSAVGNLRTVCAAQVSYRAANPAYGTFDDLTGADPPYLTGDWDASKNGYLFVIANNDETLWDCTASPEVEGQSGERFFFVDQTGVIFVGTSAAGTPLGE